MQVRPPPHAEADSSLREYHAQGHRRVGAYEDHVEHAADGYRYGNDYDTVQEQFTEPPHANYPPPFPTGSPPNRSSSRLQPQPNTQPPPYRDNSSLNLGSYNYEYTNSSISDVQSHNRSLVEHPPVDPAGSEAYILDWQRRQGLQAVCPSEYNRQYRNAPNNYKPAVPMNNPTYPPGPRISSPSRQARAVQGSYFNNHASLAGDRNQRVGTVLNSADYRTDFLFSQGDQDAGEVSFVSESRFVPAPATPAAYNQYGASADPWAVGGLLDSLGSVDIKREVRQPLVSSARSPVRPKGPNALLDSLAPLAPNPFSYSPRRVSSVPARRGEDGIMEKSLASDSFLMFNHIGQDFASQTNNTKNRTVLYENIFKKLSPRSTIDEEIKVRACCEYHFDLLL